MTCSCLSPSQVDRHKLLTMADRLGHMNHDSKLI